jgi:hypothetical protein
MEPAVELRGMGPPFGCRARVEIRRTEDSAVRVRVLGGELFVLPAAVAVPLLSLRLRGFRAMKDEDACLEAELSEEDFCACMTAQVRAQALLCCQHPIANWLSRSL